jgi:CBS domain-containing protein
MLLKDVMTRDVEVVSPQTNVVEVAGKMKNMDVGALPVCDGQRLLGMITDRDITLRVVAEGRDPGSTRAQEAMTPEVVYCLEDQPVEEAADLMAQHQIRRLPILNRDKRLVGIVSLGDLAVDTADEDMAGRALEGVSEPARPNRQDGPRR